MSRKGKCGKEYTACKNLMKSFNECEARGNDAQVSGDTASQIAASDITSDSNGAVNSRDVQENDQNEDEEQTKRIREELKRFLNATDEGLPVPRGEDEEQWRKRRKKFNEEITNETISQWRDEGYQMEVEDLFASAALQQFEQGDSVMDDYGSEGDESDEEIEDNGDDENGDDIELNANHAPGQVRKKIEPKKGVAMNSFDDIMHDRVDVEPLNLSAKTTCPKCEGEKLEAEQKIGVCKHYCCQNGAVLDVDDQPMPFRKLDRSSRDPEVVAEIELRDLLRNEEKQSPQRRTQYSRAKHLHQYARGFNNQVAFSSAVAKPILGTARPPFQGNYAPMVIMQGDLNHFVGDVCGDRDEPQFMQLWTLDPNTNEPSRNPTDRRMQTFCSRFSDLTQNTKRLTYRLFDKIDTALRSCNRFVREVFSLSELASEFRECDQYQFCFRPDARPAGEHERHYTNPAVDNGFITTIMDDEGEEVYDDIDVPVKKGALFIRYRNEENRQLRPVPLINEKSSALRFPLLYLRGQNDWDPHWKRVIGRVDQDMPGANDAEGVAAAADEHAHADVPPEADLHDEEAGDVAVEEERDLPHEEDENSNDDSDREDVLQEDGDPGDAPGVVERIIGLFGTIFSPKRMSVCDYASWHFFERDTYDNYFKRTGKLWHEWINTKYATAERQRLDFLKQNQQNIRASAYAGYVQPEDDMNEDAIRDRRMRQVFIPSSFTGGKRDRYRKYQDGVAMVAKHGKPDLFITMTCNKYWPEIKALLKPNQQPDDAPEVIARVFYLRARQLMKEIKEKQIFGKYKAHVMCYEWQQRGYPHLHLNLWLAKPLRNAEDIDNLVSAELGPKGSAIRKIILENNIHGIKHRGCAGSQLPCRAKNKNVCQKNYPYPHCNSTEIIDLTTEQIYHGDDPRVPLKVQYRRREGYNEYDDDGYTNTNVVPYNPYLSLRFQCHINVEYVHGALSTVKYLMKYVSKSINGDRTVVGAEKLDEDGEPIVNDIISYIDARAYGPCEAAHRLLKLPLFNFSHTIVQLDVHLEDDPLKKERSTLLSWFEFNKDVAIPLEDKPLYPEMVNHYRWNKSTNKWVKLQKRKTTRIARLRKVNLFKSPSEYYLRLLLSNPVSRGATSFRELRTINGITFDSYKEACSEAGLIFSEQEVHKFLDEAAIDFEADQFREAFILNVAYAAGIDTREELETKFFDKHIVALSADFAEKAEYIVRHVRVENSVLAHDDVTTDEETQNIWYVRNALTRYALTLRFKVTGNYSNRMNLFEIVERENCPAFTNLIEFAQNNPVNRFHEAEALEGVEHCREVSADNRTGEISRILRKYDKVTETRKYQTNVRRANDEQRTLIDTVVQQINSNDARTNPENKAIFVDAPAGTGKTFCFQTLLSYVRSRGEIAVAVAGSGIAGTLLEGGTTFHARMKAYPDHEGEPFPINPTEELWYLLKRTRLFIWDEATMMNNTYMRRLDEKLREIHEKPDIPWGGACVVMAGDFRQNLPIVRHGNRVQIIAASLFQSCKTCGNWEKHVRILRLTQNMRMETARANGRAAEVEQWLKYTMKLGNGELRNAKKVDKESGIPLNVKLPKDKVMRSHEPVAIEWTYGELLRRLNATEPGTDARTAATEAFARSAILTPKHLEVNALNATMAELFLPDEETHELLSSDEIDPEFYHDDRCPTIEWFHKQSPPGIPPHKLVLKTGMVVLLVRNLNKEEKLCNGSKLQILRVFDSKTGLVCRHLETGKIHIIPRIPLDSKELDYDFKWKRRQFPILPAFALTITKAQGQTLTGKVGVYLPNPVFQHGSLYVAATRVVDPANIMFFTPNEREYTVNIVYPEVKRHLQAL